MRIIRLFAILLGLVAAVSTAAQEITPASDTAFSCAHFRARLRSSFASLEELQWYLDTSAGRAQLKEYFKNRLAADPYGVVGQKAADVKWILPAGNLAGAQVVGIWELGRQDYSGAQMSFEVLGRSVLFAGDTIEVRTPVRMVDVCVNGYVEIKSYSDCPVDVGGIAFPLCKRVETRRLSLDKVEAAIAATKAVAARGESGEPFPLAALAPVCDDDAVRAAALLEQLKTLRRVHNCEVNVAKRETAEKWEYSVYARDRRACQKKKSDCLESEVSFAVRPECMAGVQGAYGVSRFTSGVRLKDSEFSAYLGSRLNRQGQIMELVLGHIDRVGGQLFDRVSCRPEIEVSHAF